MKVLHIHRFGIDGGAGGAISMRRLHFGLRDADIDSKILCVRKTTENSHVVISSPTILERKWNSFTKKLTSPFGLEDVLNINSHRIKKNRNYVDADIISFYRIPDVFSYLAFPSLTKNKSAVITLSEMWSFTGHCRNSLDCQRWKTGCGKCPYTNLPPAIQHDGTHLQWKLKEWVYSRSKLTVVAPSIWLAELAKESIIGCFPVHHIPIGIDTEVYKPLDPEKCRLSFGIPPGKKVLMFAAQRMDNLRLLKGGDLLLKALEMLPKSLKDEIVLLVMGHKGELISENTNIQAVNLGYISDDVTKAMAYSAADLFVSPTRAENFSLVLLESIACGTPLVSFGVGGVPDLVRPGITGYLSEPDNVEDLCNGIVQLLEDQPLRNKMRKKCRAIALEEYTIELMVQRYSDLYHLVKKDESAFPLSE